MRLWIVRHAKSSWNQPGQPDFERVLNPRGLRNAPAMANWLSQQTHPASWIWTSAAVRAKTTADYVARGFGLPKSQVHATRELYLADPHSIISVLQSTPQGTPGVAIVGHNPGLTDLVNLLAGENVTDNLPTFGVAEFACADRLDRDWLNLRLPTARKGAEPVATLCQLMSPKQLP